MKEFDDLAATAAFMGMTPAALQSALRPERSGPPCRLVGNKLLFRKSDVVAYLESLPLKGSGRRNDTGFDDDRAAVAILDRVLSSWADGRMASVGLTFAALDRVLRPHLRELVSALANPRPFVACHPAVDVKDWPDGAFAFRVYRDGFPVEIVYAADGRITSSTGDAPVARGLLALVGYVLTLRNGQLSGPPEAAAYLLMMLGQHVLLSLSARSSRAPGKEPGA